MRSHRRELAVHGIGFWGPRRTRKSGMFDGLFSRANVPVPEIILDQARRNWRDVTQDVADSFAGASIEMHDFAGYANRPGLRLAQVVGCPKLVEASDGLKLNEAPDLEELRQILTRRGEAACNLPQGSGRYQPFNADARSELKELFADDMFWAKGGAGGVATYIDHISPEEAGLSLPLALNRGHHYDQARGLDRAS
ncbi:hypothetical protein KO498_02755 [Lentibacter algarum]|nr:hypothetical protein [Lentibacter algarum]